MICEIHKCDSWESTLSYLESKLKEPNEAKRFGENLFLLDDELNLNTIVESFKETFQLNQRVGEENKIFHASINFDVTDKPTDDQVKEITEAYIQRMGYSNCPYVTYKHTDKAHMHIHVFSSNVDYDGNVVDRFNNYRNSQQFARQTEKKYNLFNVKYEKNIKSSLGFINSSRFAFDKALRRCIKSKSLKSGLEDVLNYKDFDKLLKRPQNNDFYKAFLGADAFFGGIDFFKKYDLYQDPLKMKLISKLYHIRENSSGGKDFLNKVKEENIYARRIFVKGKPTLTYGFEGLYINQDKLPDDFSFNKLFSYTEDPFKNFDKKGLAYRIGKILEQSNSLADFKSNLEKHGIEFITHENSGGIYGVSFKAKVNGKVKVFKGSELSKQNLTWSKIRDHLSSKSSNEKVSLSENNHIFMSKTVYNVNNLKNKVLSFSGGFNDFSSSSNDFAVELLSKKRRNKDMERE